MMNPDMTASKMSRDARFPGMDAENEVIEVPLLLTTQRAEALVALSRQRHQSVGQILRNLIDRELAEEACV